MSSDASLPIAIREAQPPAIAAVDPTVARNESIAQLLNTAYQRASMLELSDEESAKLMEPFPDEAYSRRDAKRGDQSIVYLEHAYIRDRLFRVFGPGRWTTINRRQWVDRDSDTIYVDMVMLARGAYVGEGVGCQKYDIGGHRLSYGEAMSGAESDALSRICGKILGIGLDAWKKSFREEWKHRNPVGGSPTGQPIDQDPGKPNGGKKPAEKPPADPADAWSKWKTGVLARVNACTDGDALQKAKEWLAAQKCPPDIKAELDHAIRTKQDGLDIVGTLGPQDADVNQEPDNPDAAADSARAAEERYTMPIMALTTLSGIADFRLNTLPTVEAALRPRVEQLLLIQELTMVPTITRCLAIKNEHPELEYQANLRITEIKDAAKMEAGAKT